MTEPNGPRTLLTGRGLLESPRWHGDRLYFSDWSAGEVLAVDLAGRSEVIARVRSLPLCTAWRPDGRLLIVSSPDGRLLRREPDGSLVTFADLGRPGWNDIVVDGRGNAYVNRAGFNPMAGEEFRPGSVHLVTADGAVRQVADDIAFPNGMTVTADNSTLIVADSYRHQLVGFDIGADGGLPAGASGPTSATVSRTASAPTLRTPSGTPTCPTGGAYVSRRTARRCRPSTWTAGVSPVLSAAWKEPRCSSWPPNGVA
jgi:sugar lactone lactonase YvrE